MTLRTKFHTGLLALLVMSATASAFTWWSARQTATAEGRIERAYRPVQALLALDRSINQYLSLAMRAGSDVDGDSAPGSSLAATRVAVDQQLGALRRGVQEEAAYVEKHGLHQDRDGELAHVEHLTQQVAIIYQLVDRAQALDGDGEEQQRGDLLAAAHHAFSEGVVALLDQWIRDELDQMRVAEERAARTAGQAARATLVVPLASGVLVLLAFGLLLPRLQKQLDQINAATERLAQGDFVTRLPDMGTDELGQIARGLNHMAGDLSAMTRRFEETRAQLVQAQKMEAIGRLAGGIAHDFNNILVVILANCDILREEDLPPAWRAGIEEITHAGERSASLIKKLLAFSRQRAFEPQVVRVHDVLLDMSAMLRRLLRSDIELVILSRDDLWLTRLDRSNLEQVLLNLVVNARDAMPEGGKITVESSNSTVPQESLTDSLPPDEYVCIAVSDTGSGMSPEVKEHIFEPFFTTKESGRGTGLGLATCYGLVTQVGGHIRVDTALGQGTTFRIYLPRAESEQHEAIPSIATSPDLRGRESILMVEDEPSVRATMMLALQRYGYDVVTAENGAAALRAIAARDADTFDLVVADMIMPEMTGIELARQLKAEHPDLCILFISGYADHTIVTRDALRLGNGFLHKPFRAYELAAAVRKALSGGEWSGQYDDAD